MTILNQNSAVSFCPDTPEIPTDPIATLVGLESHQFRTFSDPTPAEIHRLIVHLVGKRHTDLRIIRSHRGVSVIVPLGAAYPSDLYLQSNGFEFQGSTPACRFEVERGDVARISFDLCYTINSPIKHGRLGKTQVPFDRAGCIKPACKEHFLRYLERATGLALLQADTSKISIRPYASVPGKPSIKAMYVGASAVEIEAVVQDSLRFSSLAGRSIGNRRTYGFGSVVLEQVLSA